MPATDTPHGRVRGFVGETPRPRIPLTSIVGSSRSQHMVADPVHHTVVRDSGSTSSAKRHAYASVPRWPTQGDYPDSMTSATRAVPSATPLHTAHAGDNQYLTANSSIRRRIGTASTPMYTSAARNNPTPKPSNSATASSFYREGTAARLFGDEHMNMTTSRIIKGAPQSQEVVLFALHPQTVVRPLRKAVRQVFTSLLEWLLDTLQRQGMPRNVALARLNRTRWFPRLFDYVAIERMLNIFKLYLNQSDVLAVPRDFTDVYDAFSHEINRYCLSESTRSPTDEARGRAIVVGGIDFTEETLRSMSRPVEPWPQHPSLMSNHTSVGLTPGPSGIVGDGSLASPHPQFPTDPSQPSIPTNTRGIVNRRYIINQDNLSVLGSLVSRLQGALRQRKQLLDDLVNKRAQLEAQLNERRSVLLKLCVSIANKRIMTESLDFKTTLLEVQQQFDPSTSGNRTSRALEEIEQHMHVIGKSAKTLSKM
ncbi:hypothetical protein BaOVIS_031430 [Babesia ovis]|uniref:Uncharacterized protein n=1 Tax=Babesia ovis TaxID=5869 RepID=A0A9W5WWB1_BABOV|nr:hypothetical protein BaOVIS_031430 [Babesia ovis]